MRTHQASISTAELRQFRITPRPVVTRGTMPGDTIRALMRGWVPTPSRVDYQWLRDGKPIKHARSSQYRLRSEDAGSELTVRVTAWLPGYESFEHISKPLRIPQGSFEQITPTRIQGRNRVGQKLNVQSHPWKPTPNWSRYQWYRDGEPIRGATDVRYIIQEADLGHNLTVEARRQAPGTEIVSGASAPLLIGGCFNDPDADTLLATGAFDARYYSAVVGQDFESDHAAASHYISVGMREMISPNFLIDVSRWPAHLRKILHTGAVEELARILCSNGYLPKDIGDPISYFVPASEDTPILNVFSPAFDSLEVRGATEVFASEEMHSLFPGPLGVFLSTMDEDTALSLPRTSKLYGRRAVAYRADMIEGARALAEQHRIYLPRETASWDEFAEREWKRTVRAVPLANEPLVSIVMPVWNRRDIVGEAIDSVIAQSYQNWELLVVDDFSTDGSLEYLRERAGEDPRITALISTAKGVCPARNTGLDAARGTYIAFLDSDNEWRPDYLELMVLAMERDNLTAAYSGEKIWRGSRKAPIYRGFAGDRQAMYYVNHIDLNVFMLRTDLAREIGGFDDSLRRWVDYDLIFRVDAVCPPVLLPFIGCDYNHDKERADRISVYESSSWRWVVFAKAMQDWVKEESKERVPGRVSIVLPCDGDYAAATAGIETILVHADVDDLEIVLMDYSTNLAGAALFVRQWAGHPSVIYRRLSRSYHHAGNRSLGFLQSSGEHVLFLNTGMTMRSGGLRAMLARLSDPQTLAVQAITVTAQGSVCSAGKIWLSPGFLPADFLRGLPLEDSQGVAEISFPAISGAGMMMRASDVVALRGFDPGYFSELEDLDLCLRLAQERPGHFVVEPSCVLSTPGKDTGVTPEESEHNRLRFLSRWRAAMPEPTPQAYKRAGMSLEGIVSDSVSCFTPAPLLRRLGTTRRWGIKSFAPATARGDLWGDTHFTESLAHSLRGLGQEVVIHRQGAHCSSATHFDDVSVVIRGRFPAVALPGQFNILWVISHPEDVTEQEIQGFDVVLASSQPWAHMMSERWGIPVGVMHQATDSSRFFWQESLAPQLDAVFVGGHLPTRIRKVVHNSIEAGLSVRVYGPGWDKVIPAEYYGGAYVANEELAEVYRSARFVLADHWEDMAVEGFVQNRLFDAVAAGRRVISDPVAGLREVFDEQDVVTYEGTEDLRRIMETARDEEATVSSNIRRDAAERVAAEHSFDVRASQLLALVEDREIPTEANPH